ncbi:MAG: hypothetical protein ACTSRK_18305 [Promethearchaeota archaeon]
MSKPNLYNISGVLIDVAVFLGSNSLVGRMYPVAKPNMSDTAVYALVDVMVRSGTISDEYYMKLMHDVDSEMGSYRRKLSHEAYISIVAALGIALKDSLMKKRLVFVPALVKAFVAGFSNASIDEVFKLDKLM